MRICAKRAAFQQLVAEAAVGPLFSVAFFKEICYTDEHINHICSSLYRAAEHTFSNTKRRYLMKVSELFVRQHDPKQGLCFVLMPFQEALTAVYELGIKPQVEAMGMQCRRADEIYSGQAILGDIWDSIQTAELIIADCTGKNPNVMYELGLCHAIWKRVILLSQNRDDVPFDLRQWRVIWYDFTFAGATRLKEELGRAIDALRQDKGMEARPVALSGSGSAQPDQPEHESKQQWLHGKIETWKTAGRPFGFIKSGDESYWFNLECCFSSIMEPVENAKVTFKPLPPMPNAKNKRASSIFIEGTKLHGKVNNVVKGNGFAFATINGNHGQSHSIYLETGKDLTITVGTVVEFIVGENNAGPIGCHVKVVDAVS
jgi:hypothetical protein